MAVDAIGGAVGNTASNVQQATLGQDDFLKILLTQLQFQDPLKPMDNQQFIAQMAQFTTLEQTKEINDQMGAILSMQSTNQSVGLIGKTVEVNTSSGSQVGVVGTVTFQNGAPQLTVTTSNNAVLTNINLSQITVIR